MSHLADAVNAAAAWRAAGAALERSRIERDDMIRRAAREGMSAAEIGKIINHGMREAVAGVARPLSLERIRQIIAADA